MRTIMIRRRNVDLPAEMTAMRAWLDQSGYEPARFACERYGEMTIICVDFAEDPQAEAFSEHFGTPSSASQPPAPRAGAERYPDLSTWGPRIGEPETMLQVCRWRIMAEEILAEADGFSTATAQETMRAVAETWDLMAENLERRLLGRQSQARS